MTNFTDHQRRMWVWLSFLSLCRFHIKKENGKYVIEKCGKFRITIYYILWINSLVKIFYMVLTYQGLLVEVHFLDQMSMWDYFLCFSQLIQEVNIWFREYPLYEVLHANWTIQEDIFRKLGSPAHLDDKITHNDQFLVYLHTTIVTVGCSAIGLQFFTSPKYALFTYAIVPWDNLFLRIIFATHECIYIFHIWVHQAGSIVLCEVFAVSYTHILREMTKVMNELIELGEDLTEEELLNVTKRNKNAATALDEQNGIHHSDFTSEISQHQRKSKNNSYHETGKMKNVNPRTIVPGTEYDIMTLLNDYRNVMLATDSFNKWVGKLMAGTNGSNYGQFVSDVFNMIQLLKEPDVDMFGVVFFFEDACAGMIMLFRMLILMSRMYPASEEFLQTFKVYLTHETALKKYFLKRQRTMKIVAAKIGGYKTRPITVPQGVNLLMNWYICAAMWHRPSDRRT